jgi:hypothetical protein
MQYRRLLLKIMLVSLAAAAFVGAMGVMLGEAALFGRFAGSALLTGFAALVAMGVLKLWEKDASPTASVMAMGLVVVEFLIAQSQIWLPRSMNRYAGYRLDWQLFGTFWWLLVTVGPACVIVRMMERSRASMRAAGPIGLTAAGGVLVLTMLSTWLPRIEFLHDRLWAWTFFAGMCGLLAMVSSVGEGFPPRGWWRWAGAGLALAAWGWSTISIFLKSNPWSAQNELDLKFVISAMIAAGTIGFVNILLAVSIKSSQRWLCIGTAVVGSLAGLALVASVWSQNRAFEDEVFNRLAGALSIPAGCGAIGMLVLAKLNRKSEGPPPAPINMDRLKITCPHCQNSIEQAIGVSECAHCRLRFSLRIIEPRCHVCDYVLLDLKSDNCPECGTKVSLTPAVAG